MASSASSAPEFVPQSTSKRLQDEGTSVLGYCSVGMGRGSRIRMVVYLFESKFEHSISAREGERMGSRIGSAS